MAEYLIQDTTLDAIADAINAKTGGSSAMTPAEMVTAIGSISGGGGIAGWEYQKFTFTPTEDIGQYGSGGFPATEQYIKNLLPSGWVFARVIYQSGQKIAYGLNELRCSSWGKPTEFNRFNTNLEPTQIQGNNATSASYSAILSSGCVYQVEVFKVVTANG